MVINEPISDWAADKFFAGGLTYSGHPLACATGVASIEAFREEGIVENAAAMGDALAEELPKLAERHASIGDVRGLGLFWGLELVKDRDTREMLVPFNASGDAATPIVRLAKAAMERGLYLFVHWNVIMIAPPLTITREELDEGLGDPRRDPRDRRRVRDGLAVGLRHELDRAATACSSAIRTQSGVTIPSSSPGCSPWTASRMMHLSRRS